MIQPLHLVEFVELNRISVAEADTESGIYCSNNAMSGHLYIILLFMTNEIAEPVKK